MAGPDYWHRLVPQLADQTGDFAIILTDPEGVVTGWNRGAEQMLGYPRAEIVGVPVAAIFTDEDRARGVPAGELARAERDGRAEDTRWHRRRDGSHVWVTGATTAVRDDAGRLLGFGKIARDATALREAELRLRGMIDAAMDAIVSVDDDERVVVFNEAAERIFGVPASEAVGGPVERFIPLRFREVHHEHIRRFATSGATTRSVHDLAPVPALRADGTEFPIEATLSMVEVAGQRLYTVIIRDVTRRVQAEAELRASEARLRAIVGSVGRGVAVLTRAGDFVMANEQLAAMLGEAAGALPGRNLREFTPPARSAADDAAIDAALWEPRSRTIEQQLRRRDGAEILVRITPSLLPEDAREPTVVIVVEDITESRRAEEAMRHTQRLEAIGVLAAGVAHDFNNLLTAIIGNVSLALRAAPPDDPADLRAMLGDALGASERAAELVRELLVYAGKQRVAAGPVDLCRLVRDVAGLLRASIPRQVELRYELPERCPPIEGDAGQLQQVVMNIVLNAAEAIGDDPGTVTLRVAREEWSAEQLAAELPQWELAAGSYLVFEVRDTGAGMDAETLERIFDPFFTTRFLGRGLGLAAVHGIVRGHGGGLAVRSAPGEGTTFRMLLPASEARPAPGPAPPGVTDAPADGGGTVAVVDDEEAVRRMATRALEAAGYGVVTAGDGRAAVDLVARRGGEIALLLLDLSMPVMGGAEAVPLIRRHRPDLPVVLMTGYGDEATLERARQLGVAAILQKPFTADQLVARVREVLAAAG